MGLGELLLSRGMHRINVFLLEKNGEGVIETGENGDLVLLFQETDASDLYTEKIGFVTSRKRGFDAHIDQANPECNLAYFTRLGSKSVHLSRRYELEYMGRILDYIENIESTPGIKIEFVGAHQYDEDTLQRFRESCTKAEPEEPKPRESGAYSRADIARILGW